MTFESFIIEVILVGIAFFKYNNLATKSHWLFTVFINELFTGK